VTLLQRSAFLAAALLAILLFPASAGGQSKDELRREIEQLKEEREDFQAELLAQAAEVDAATAEVGEVEQALADLEFLVSEQRDDVFEADRALASAEAARQRCPSHARPHWPDAQTLTVRPRPTLSL